jgi:3-carboxy-cis,cis-muconate cycloisomerase
MNPEFDGDRIFSAAAHIDCILRFEAALARALARAGVMSSETAEGIEQICRIELFNIDDLQRDAIHAGTIATPLVQQLISRAPKASRLYVHWGATSQDAIDTALVLQMRTGLDALVADLHETADASAALAETHRRSVMPGRTLLQQAVPITFGLKAARWLGALARQTQALRTLRREALVLQFGGAAGTLAALGDVAPEIARLLGEELDLPVPDLPWHAERDRPATVVAALGVTAGVVAKIATDIVLMAQTEVAEVAEGLAVGKGISSAMPHKRNPVDATNAIAAARLAIGAVPVVLSAMPQEHERGAGGWQAEWTAIPDAFRHTLRAAAHARSAVAGLDVRPDQMRANLDRGAGALMAESLATALTGRVGRPEAQRIVMDLVESAFRHQIPFREAVSKDPAITEWLNPEALARALDPAAYLGSTNLLIDRALRSWRDLNQADQR